MMNFSSASEKMTFFAPNSNAGNCATDRDLEGYSYVFHANIEIFTSKFQAILRIQIAFEANRETFTPQNGQLAPGMVNSYR